MTVSLGAFRVLTCSANVGYLNGLVIPHAVELKDIKAIIDLMRKNDLSVFEMEKDGFRLKLQKGIGEAPISMVPAPAHAVQNGPAAANATAAAPAVPAEKSELRDIVSPMVGTFY